jgi:hypothetical protein
MAKYYTRVTLTRMAQLLDLKQEVRSQYFIPLINFN